jgi:cation/acetate symporter
MARLNLMGTFNSNVGITQSASGALTTNPAVISANPSLFAPEASLKYEDRPEWVKRWEKTGLLKFEDKNGDGRIQYYNDRTTNAAAKANFEAAGWKGNELTVNNDIIVLANPEIAQLPNWVIALVAAGAIAAALSTAAGLLLAISSAISHDLVKRVFKPDLSEKGELMAGRIAMIAAIILAGYLGLNPPGFAAATVALAFGLAASSLFPAIMMGIFSKTITDKGAIAGMIAGMFATCFYVFAHHGIFFIQGTSYVQLIGGPNSFFGLTPAAFGTVGALVNFAVAILVSKVSGGTVPKHVQEMVEAVRVPKGAGSAVAH